MPRPLRILDESQATLASFHDVHVHGLHWRRDQFAFSMDVQYIVAWIPPADGSTGYRFSICEARITFADVDELKLSIDWSGAALDAQIAEVRVAASRTTPSGVAQRHYEIELSDPEGAITLWSTGYQVALLTEPVLSLVTSIRIADES
jgi:hypothetical protein